MPKKEPNRSVYGYRRALLLTLPVAACLIVGACSSTRTSPYSADMPLLGDAPAVLDHRGRFREIFCAILDQRASSLPDARDCETALTRAGIEPNGTEGAVDLGQSHRGLVAVVVPGIGWDCFSNWLDLEGTAAAHIHQFGYELVGIDVESLSSSTANARQIRDAIMAMEPHRADPYLVLIGYSKGAPDVLEAMVAYPEIHKRVAAVISIAGAIRGSPVADDVTQSKLELLKHWPGAECTSGDGGAIESLRPATRIGWLAENPLPSGVPYYSLATCPEPDRISAVLKRTYKKLSRFDPRNDGMVLVDDQIIPDSSFLGCVNADHWAVSVPIARTHPHIGSTLVDKNDYPREALLEALLRFVEEDLKPPP